MKYITLFLALTLSLNVHAQFADKLKIKATIETFFDGFHTGDTALMRSVLMDQVYIQTALQSKRGDDVLVFGDIDEMLTSIADRPDDQTWDERILEYSFQVDGNMAHAWTPYEFWFNGEFHHCGANSFQLFNDNGAWKIVYLIDSRRRASCTPEQE